MVMSTSKIPYVDVRLEYLDVFTWTLLSKRSGHIRNFPLCFRMGVGEDDGTSPLHAWFHLSHAGRMSLTPHDIPFNLERMIHQLSGVTCIINTQKLENNWLQATCHTGRFDISVQHARYWDKLMAIPFAQKYFEISVVTGQGAVSSHAASLGKMAYAEALGPFPLDIINLPGRTADASLLRVLEEHDIEWQGTKTRVNGYRCTITIGFSDPESQIKAAKLFSRKKFSGINRNQPLRIAVVWDVPQGHCRSCYNPDNADNFSRGHSKGGKNKKRCPNLDNICLICKSTAHAIINCPFEETKLIAVKKENVMYEAPTLSAAALAGRDKEKTKAKSSKAASARSYGSLSLNRFRGYNASSSDEDPSGPLHSQYLIPNILIISQRPSLQQHTKRSNSRPPVSHSTIYIHLYPIAFSALLFLLICYNSHLIPSLLLALLLAAALASPTIPLNPPPQQSPRLLPLPILHFLLPLPSQLEGVNR